MIFYLEGSYDERITGLAVESIEISENSHIDDVDWTEQDVGIENGEFTIRLKEIFFNESYANRKGAMLAGCVAKVDFDIFEVDGKSTDSLISPITQSCYDELYKSITCNKMLILDDGIEYVIPVKIFE